MCVHGHGYECIVSWHVQMCMYWPMCIFFFLALCNVQVCPCAHVCICVMCPCLYACVFMNMCVLWELKEGESLRLRGERKLLAKTVISIPALLVGCWPSLRRANFLPFFCSFYRDSQTNGDAWPAGSGTGLLGKKHFWEGLEVGGGIRSFPILLKSHIGATCFLGCSPAVVGGGISPSHGSSLKPLMALSPQRAQDTVVT